MHKLLRSVSIAMWISIIGLLMLAVPIIIEAIHYLNDPDQLRFEDGYEVFLAFALTVTILGFLLLRRVHTQDIKNIETERNLFELIDNAADMILITKPGGDIIRANRAACQKLGFSEEEIRHLKTHEIDTECTLNRTPRLHQKLFSGESITFETYYQTKHGDKIPVENHVSVAGWLEDQHYLEVARDITRRKLVENQLNASRSALELTKAKLEERMQERSKRLAEEVEKRELTERRIHEIRLLLENLVNSMPSVIIALDSSFRITQWNLEAEKVFGIPEGEAVGHNLIKLLPQYNQHIMTLADKSQRGQKAIKQTIDLVIREQALKFNVVLYPLSESVSSRLPGVVIRLDDITERARIDEVLVQTEKMLSLGGLAAGMAHEINNPLGAILQSAQNIARRLSPNFPRNRKVASSLGVDIDDIVQYLDKQKVLETLEVMREAGERAAAIVSDMLSFARPSQGQNAPVDLEQMVQSTLRLAEKDISQRQKLDFRQINIQQSYMTGLPKIAVQKNQLQQVLLNLLSNAAQALANQPENNRPSIHIYCNYDATTVSIKVEDNGPGIPPDVAKRIFEPFFTTKAEGQGTGLGLSVSYFIVNEQLGGRMFLAPDYDKGACFVVQLPREQSSVSALTKDSTEQQIQLPFE